MLAPEPPTKTKTTPFISGVLVAIFLISLWSYTHPPQTQQTQIRHDPTKVILVTGSQPGPCKNPVGDNLLLKLFKNKVDYCRRHSYDIVYNNVVLDPNMPGYWAKYPVIRSTMVAHPEAEWLWWVDSDAVITDMDFSFPVGKYLQHNLIILIHEKKNTGVFLIRNCQWSMDLLDRLSMFSPISPESDDQRTLGYLLVKEGKKWRNKIYLENEWVGGLRRPFITHFTGCQPCNGEHNEMYTAEECSVGMIKALNFADNQVLRNFGYYRPDLSNSSFVKRISLD